MQVELLVGVRVRLSARGVGKWALSGGDGAKFGLSTSELLEAIEYLRKEGCPEATSPLRPQAHLPGRWGWLGHRL
jgi:arginine decarboxylase